MRRISIVIVLIILSLYKITVYADVGPKPSIEIIASNMPDEICYMDLLINYPDDDVFKNIRNTDNYDSDMFNTLFDYNEDGWRPALVTGTKVPLHGDIICNVKSGKCHMDYSYRGVPDKFKIIVVTKSNKIVVSNIIERKAFDSRVYFDYSTGIAREDSLILLYFEQFVLTLSLTLLIEGLILILFNFSIRKNYKPFIIINLITQILLTLVVVRNMITNGTMIALLIYFLFEIVILLIEVKSFSVYLLEHTIHRRKIYAVVANVISFITGVIIMLKT